MLPLLEKLKTTKAILSDGAWGTSLQQLGLEAGACPELWNIEEPERVQSVAQGFIDAGSEMVKTNSFGGNRFKLESFGLQDRVAEINEKAAQCSRAAAGADVYVMGSIGPTGKMLITGEVTDQELYDAFSIQAKALENGGADIILVETMSDLEEARIAVRAAGAATSCEIACTMTFEQTADGGFRTMMGISPTRMVETLQTTDANMLGSNCGNGVQQMVPIVKEMRSVSADIPIAVHANAGMPVFKDGQTSFPETPEETAKYVPDLVAAGANIIGGCCGTTPEHIRKMREKLD